MRDYSTLIILLVIGAALSAILPFYSKRARNLRALRKVPLRTVREAMRCGGVVRLRGRLRLAEHHLEAPLTGRPCAWYEVKVQEHSHQHQTRWDTLIEERDGVDFLLEDDTGVARVSGLEVRAAITADASFSSGLLNEPDARQVAFLESHEESPTETFFNRTLRYREGILEEGEFICVAGVCRPPEAGGSSDHALVVESGEDFQLIITDDRRLKRD